MAYLELAQAITAISFANPRSSNFSNNTLHHLRSRHTFRFLSDGDMEIHAACDCASLRASAGAESRCFTRRIGSGNASYWRPFGNKSRVHLALRATFIVAAVRHLAAEAPACPGSRPRSSSIRRPCRCSL